MSDVKKNEMAVALKELLMERPLSKITISDITDKCGCSRMTFYYHFQNVYDLLRWMVRKECRESINYRSDLKQWDKNLLVLCSFLYNNRTVVRNLHNSIRKEDTAEYLHGLLYSLIVKTMEGFEESRGVSERNIKFIADFYKYAVVGILMNWIDTDMKEEPERIVNAIYILVKGSIVRAMVNFADKDITDL